eukprot:CAMPEP_0197306532 /NCGR_PEP_ID=MMETSP0891-20130614/3496_1 /TAXON_ID=44058 ORGANISM="Aureoumbra lagunensis, Strain CCMP1510" /NCGR_SAMPLE_ID=MMETSP0891 /ASSEMBLY_ACC=CAM_ASM_000534 /LENGTH=35 /DNA_ID= /DNA_START= /DNA_END= /DNA_ORIENTATION=
MNKKILKHYIIKDDKSDKLNHPGSRKDEKEKREKD